MDHEEFGCIVQATDMQFPQSGHAERLRILSLIEASRLSQEDLRAMGFPPLLAKRVWYAIRLATLGRTRQRGERRPVFDKPEAIVDHVRDLFAGESREIFVMITLDSRHRPKNRHVISIGALDVCIVHPREVFLPAVLERAYRIVLVHNHPSGDSRPSDEDLAVTERLVDTGKLLGIEVLDHIVIGEDGFTSIKGFTS